VKVKDTETCSLDASLNKMQVDSSYWVVQMVNLTSLHLIGKASLLKGKASLLMGKASLLIGKASLMGKASLLKETALLILKASLMGLG
jgi:hypothetical protein